MLSKLLPTPSDLPLNQVRTLRQNILMHLADGSFYVLGMSLVSMQTILPIFLKELGGSPVSIGSVHVLWWIGQNIPGIAVAHSLRRRTEFKFPMVLWGFIHRAMLLVCAVAAYFLIGRIPAEAAVPLFLFLIFLIPTFGGFSGIPWFQVFTKTVPVKLRGRLMGIRQLIGSAAGAFGGTMVSIILFAVAYPSNFALLFLLAFVFTMISFIFLMRIQEEPSVREEQSVRKRELLSNAWKIIASNRNFRNFLIADAFVLMSIAASSFYSVYAVEKFSLPSSYAGTFTAIVMVTNVAANIIFGIIADVYGHRTNILMMTIASGCAALFALLSTNILMYGFVFFFLACAVQIQAISRLAIVAEMCREHERPMYVGIMNTVTAPTVFIGILFGLLVPVIGYPSIFVITSLLAVNSFMILYKFVVEPRK